MCRLLQRFLVLGWVLILVGRNVHAEEPTEYDQYALELLNRARAHPTREVTRTAADAARRPAIFSFLYESYRGAPSLNEGPVRLGNHTYILSASAKQPLAFNTQLMKTVRSYAAVCQARNDIDHGFNDGGTSAEARMRSRGYVPEFPMADALRLSNGSYTAPGGEMLSFMGHSTPWSSTAQGVDFKKHAVHGTQHGLFVDGTAAGRGHRASMMIGSFREVGIAFDFGTDPGGFYSAYGVYNMAFQQGRGPFITGVAYRDKDNDGFYTPGGGEALGQIDVTVRRTSNGTLVAEGKTTTSGGYSIQVPSNDSYQVTFSGSGVMKIIPGIAVTTLNHKVDFVATQSDVPTEGAFEVGDVSVSGRAIVLRWMGQVGVSYYVEAWGEGQGWVEIPGSARMGAGNQLSYTHENALNAAFRLYRIGKR